MIHPACNGLHCLYLYNLPLTFSAGMSITSTCNQLEICGIMVDGMAPETMSSRAPGIVSGSTTPAFSWRLTAGLQQAYRILVATSPEQLAKPDLWDSGWRITRNTLAVLYEGCSMPSCCQIFFQISVEVADGRRVSSGIMTFTTGLLQPSDWQAKWIYADGFPHLAPAPVPCFRRNIQLPRKVRQALLFSTAKGLLELTINGERVDEHDFLPGWSNFDRELQYTAYDVTTFLQTGDNVLGALLADGWFVASFPGYRRNQYGDFPSFMLQLEIQFEDGERAAIISDENWRWQYGAILQSDIYDGESCNCERLDDKWMLPGFDDAAWKTPCIAPASSCSSSPTLTRKLMPGVKRLEILQPVTSRCLTDGVWIYDFGKIITGRIRMRFQVPVNSAGLRGRIRYAEVLNPDGTLYNANFRNADNVDTCVTTAGLNVWETHFTFHGFRYVQLEGLPIAGFQISDLEIEAVALTSDIPDTGTFSCGEKMLERLTDNIRNSMKCNLLEIPMDCPQRDERLGWSGDAHIFFKTAMFLADGRNFYRKYLQDLRFCQRQDGAISSIAPAITGFQYGSPGWADALPIITWELYRKSADMRILRENYPAIKAHIEYELSQAENFVLNGHTDHLSLSRITTDTHLIGTVFFHNTARIATAIANILGEKNEAAEFKTLAGNIRRAFRNNFLTEDGSLKVPTQCGFALLFYFDMLDTPEEKRRNAESFAKLIRDNRNLLDTGFLGTAYLCPALVQAGLPSIACDLLLQRDFPSWLFEVNQGATTVWERWDSYHPDKGFATPLMNSFNHYANGAIGEFIFNWLCGIDFRAVDENGDAAPAICFRMIPDPRIGNVRTVLDTPCGEALCQWELRNDTLHCHLQVPPNTIAYLHDWGKGEKLLPGTYDFNFSVRQ